MKAVHFGVSNRSAPRFGEFSSQSWIRKAQTEIETGIVDCSPSITPISRASTAQRGNAGSSIRTSTSCGSFLKAFR
jgi:hypothetical protein